MNPIIILASGSPRRKKLLEQIGLTFIVKTSDVDEDDVPVLPPHALVEYISLKKAKKISEKYPKAVVIGADTLIVCKGEIIGKPNSEKDAKDILKKLSGQVHTVITGVTVIKENKVLTRHELSKVYFKKLTDEEIDSYVKTGEPMDKAGAYGVQEKGVLFVEKIEGDYQNVVGLPIILLVNMLAEFGIDVAENWKN